MANKERIERSPTSEEQARQQIEGYIEKVEKRPEIDKDDQGVMQKVGGDDAQMPKQITDDDGKVVAEAVVEEPEIDLPLTEEEVREGLHHKIMDNIRWLAERCVYIIKKYPGRVFYKE